MDTPHKLKSKQYQWAAAGDHPSQARTTYTCELCGAKFIHWYNVEIDIAEAATAHGFNIDYCAGVK